MSNDHDHVRRFSLESMKAGAEPPDLADLETNGEAWRFWNCDATPDVQVVYASMSPGSYGAPHLHPDYGHYGIVTAGTMYMWCDGEVHACQPGDLIHIPAGVVHGYHIGHEETWAIDVTNPPLNLETTEFKPALDEQAKRDLLEAMVGDVTTKVEWKKP